MQYLGPDEMRAVGAAYDAAIRGLDETSSSVDAYSLRHSLAKLIMKSALWGERDAARLTAIAVASLNVDNPISLFTPFRRPYTRYNALHG
jgi:hypothetical protein